MGAILDQKEPFSNLTLVAIEAALQAGDLLRHGFGTSFSIASKEGKHNLVTEYDYLAEKSIIDFIKKSVPDSHFLAEESGKTGPSDGLLWIIDPLDGTRHLGNVMACCAIILDAEEAGTLDDDRPPFVGIRKVYAWVETQMAVLREKYKDLKPTHYTEKEHGKR